MEIEKLQQEILAFVQERDWKKFHTPRNLAAALSVEASELLEQYLWSNNPRNEDEMKEEVADIFYYLILFARYENLDLEKLLLEKMKKNREKYPVDKSRGNAKKYTELD